MFPGSLRTVDDPDAWERNIFQAGRGPEPWRPLLIVVLALLLVESVVAASERLRKAPSTTAAADPSRA